MAQHRANRPRPPHPAQLHPDHAAHPTRRVPPDPHLDRPTRLDPFPGAPGLYPSGSPVDVPDDVDAATVYVPSSGDLRRPLEACYGPAYDRDDADLEGPPPDAPRITYEGVVPLVVFVALVVLLLGGLLVVVPWVLT